VPTRPLIVWKAALSSVVIPVGSSPGIASSCLKCCACIAEVPVTRHDRSQCHLCCIGSENQGFKLNILSGTGQLCVSVTSAQDVGEELAKQQKTAFF